MKGIKALPLGATIPAGFWKLQAFSLNDYELIFCPVHAILKIRDKEVKYHISLFIMSINLSSN